MQVDDALLTRLEKLSFLKISDEKRGEIIEQLSETTSVNSTQIMSMQILR